MKRFCDSNCGECPLVNHANSKQLALILNIIEENYDITEIVNRHCPNMTVCLDCGVDDFCHREKCDILDEAQK